EHPLLLRGELLPDSLADGERDREGAELGADGGEVEYLAELVGRDAHRTGDGAVDGVSRDGFEELTERHGDTGRADVVDHPVGDAAGAPEQPARRLLGTFDRAFGAEYLVVGHERDPERPDAVWFQLLLEEGLARLHRVEHGVGSDARVADQTR